MEVWPVPSLVTDAWETICLPCIHHTGDTTTLQPQPIRLFCSSVMDLYWFDILMIWFEFTYLKFGIVLYDTFKVPVYVTNVHGFEGFGPNIYENGVFCFLLNIRTLIVGSSNPSLCWCPHFSKASWYCGAVWWNISSLDEKVDHIF